MNQMTVSMHSQYPVMAPTQATMMNKMGMMNQPMNPNPMMMPGCNNPMIGNNSYSVGFGVTPINNPIMYGQNNQMMAQPMNPMMANQYGYNNPMMMNQNPMMYNNGFNNGFGVMPASNQMIAKPITPMMIGNTGYSNNYGMVNTYQPTVNLQPIPSQNNTVPQNQINSTINFQSNFNIDDTTTKSELEKKLEKDTLLKQSCDDFNFILTRTDGIYVIFKRKNKEWIKNFSESLWGEYQIKFIFGDYVVYIPLKISSDDSQNEVISDNELVLFLEKLRSNFFLKKLCKSDFIKINDQIICVNSDNLLERIEKYEPSYFFISPEKNPLIQDFYSALTNTDYLFIDEKTHTRYSLEFLPRLKELENHLEEVKEYEK